MSANRSKKIYSAVIRNLKTEGTDIGENTTQVYRDMQTAQQDIITRTNCLKVLIEINVEEGKQEYDLDKLYEVGYTSSIVKPASWKYHLQFFQNEKEFYRLMADCPTLPPAHVLIVDRTLIIHGAPTSDEKLKLWAHLTNSTDPISETVEPEIESFWDLAIEYFATDKYLKDTKYFNLYLEQVNKKSHLSHTKAPMAKAKRIFE